MPETVHDCEEPKRWKVDDQYRSITALYFLSRFTFGVINLCAL
jgi:hypothetical protein